ncbi:hypothetical protein FF38_03234, partial [Lucilia cuprina]
LALKLQFIYLTRTIKTIYIKLSTILQKKTSQILRTKHKQKQTKKTTNQFQQPPKLDKTKPTETQHKKSNMGHIRNTHNKQCQKFSFGSFPPATSFGTH